MFYRQLFQIKAGSAFTGMNRRRIKRDIGQILFNVSWKSEKRFENGVAGVKLPAAEDGAAMGFVLQRAGKVLSE